MKARVDPTGSRAEGSKNTRIREGQRALQRATCSWPRLRRIPVRCPNCRALLQNQMTGSCWPRARGRLLHFPLHHPSPLQLRCRLRPPFRKL